MPFFNLITTPGLGNNKNPLKQPVTPFGQAKNSIHANPLNGNLFVTDFTKSFNEQIASFNLGYQYNSQAKTPWRLNQGKVIGPIQGQPNHVNSYVLVEESDGHESTYTYDPERDAYVNLSEEGGASTLTYSPEGQWAGWNPTTGIKESFNQNNQLETMTDASGNTLNYTYDAPGRLIAISGNSDRSVLIEYGPQTTHIYSVEGDKKSLMMHYLFDDQARLEKTVIPVNDQEHYETHYSYSTESGLLEHIKQSDQTEVHFSYENREGLYCLSTLKSGAGDEWTLRYEPNKTQVIDPIGNTKSYHKNEFGLLQKQNADGQSLSYVYDSFNRISSIHYQDGSSQEFKYDDLGCYSEVTERSGEKILFTRDAKTGLLFCETQVTSETEDERYLNTFYLYNDKQELIYKISPIGAVIHYNYDDHGNCIRQKTYLNGVFDLSPFTKDSVISANTLSTWCAQQNQAAIKLTEWTYTAFGVKASEIIYANVNENGEGINDEFAAYQEYEWNIHGALLQQKTKVNHQETSVKSIEYDGLSRPTEVNSLGQVTQHRYQNNQQQSTLIATGLCTTTAWDASGAIIEKQAQTGEFTDKSKLTYDNAGRVCIIEQLNSAKEYIVYDEHDRVLYRIDGAMRATKNSYDSNNCLIHQLKYATPLTQVDENELKKGNWQPQCCGDFCIESTFHNPNGDLLCSVNGDNFATEHRYDSRGNRIETIQYATALNLSVHERQNRSTIPNFLESSQDRVHRFYYNDANQLIGEQLPSGQAIAYHLNAHGELLSKLTSLGALPQMTHWDERLVVNAPHKGESFILDARGQCLHHTDAEMNNTNNTWDAAGNLTERTKGGETDYFVWNALGQLVKETHSSGLEVNKTYAACGKVSSETHRDAIAGTESRSRYIRYNGFGQPTHELSPRVAAKLNNPTLAEDKNWVEQIWQNESVRHVYTETGLKIRTQDELGNISTFYYNLAQELCFIISPMGSIKEYTYDPITHQCDSTRLYQLCLEENDLQVLTGGVLTPELIKQFHTKRTNQDEVLRTEYNGRGLVTLKVDAEQFSTRTEYDAFSNVARVEQQIDADNQLVCEMEYDQADRLVKKVEDVDGANETQKWQYVDEENLTVHTDSDNNSHHTYYDKLHRKIRVRDELGREATFAWDGLSRPTLTTDAMQNTVTLTYEHHGRKITETRGTSHSIVEKNAFNEVEMEQNADGEVCKKIYDVDGQLKAKIDSDNNQYRYQYNAAGWLIEVIDPLNKVTRYTHNKNGDIETQREVGLNEERVLTFQRDAQGREVLRTDANGISTQTIYDKRGLIVEKIVAPGALALRTQHEYDGLANLIKETKGDSHYPQQQTIQIVRDKLSRITKTIIDPDGLALTTELIYDSAGNCVARIDPNHHTTRFIHDAAKQERYHIDPLGGLIAKMYDKKGRCIEERHFAKAISLDGLQEFTLAEVEALASPSVEDKVSYFAYDEQDNLIASLDELGKLTQSRYSARGKKTYERCYANPMTKNEFLAGNPISSAEDRESAWFYDGQGNECFAVNGEGIVTEQRWNEKGWLIEERTYATPYFNYEHRPQREALEHPNDRSTRYVHDAYGRVAFKLDGEGYVVEYEYDQGDEPLLTRFYPEKITLPATLTLTSIRELLPAKENIPCIQIKYDEAWRKIAAIDQLNHREEFKLDALDNLREYIDKGGDSWTFEFDSAGRKTEEATPAVEVTSVTAQGQLIKPAGKHRIIKKTEYLGDVERVTEAYGTSEARTIECHKNACNQTTKVLQQGVSVHDNNKKPTKAALKNFTLIKDYEGSQLDQKDDALDKTPYRRPEVVKTLSVVTVYNHFNKPIVVIDEAGNLKFRVYQADKIRFEIDQEGFVTAYEYNVFGNIIKLTRYADVIPLDFTAFTATGIPLSTVVTSLKSSEQDRTIFLEYDRANRLIRTTQDRVFVAMPRVNGDAQYGEFSPVKINKYNAFGEVYSQLELIDPFNQQWDITRKWFNRAGHLIAQVDGLNYLTLFTTDRNGNNTKVIEYAKRLGVSLNDEITLDEMIRAQEPDPLFDRVYSNLFNARDELITATQHDVQLYDPELEVGNNTSLQSRQSLQHTFVRNAKGFLVYEQLPNGGSKTTRYDARNLPVLKTEPSRQLEKGTATPVITMAYNAFGQPTRLTHHKNPLEQDAYLIESIEDQTHLTGFDSRGLQIVAVDPEGALHCQSITETKKIAAGWIVVRGWAPNAKPTQRLHYTQYQYDKRGIEIKRSEAIETGSTVITATRSNAFGEKTAEGGDDGTYPVYWLRDKTGAVWNTNEQNGVPTITLFDTRRQETLSLTSRTRSLKAIDTVAALNNVMNWSHRDLQRLELHRDVKGAIEAQVQPAFSTLKIDAPEPYPIEVSSGSFYKEFGQISLSWPNPDSAGLEAQVLVWPKGRVHESQRLEVKKGETRGGVDVSKLATDDYQYQIDFYYRDPQNQQRDGSPRYRAEGSAVIITDLHAPTQNMVWHQIDDQRLMLYGSLGDVSGIELMQDGSSCGRVSITTTANPNQWIIDLGDKPSGQYEFRFLHGFSLVEEQALKVGVPSAKGSRIDKVATSLSQAVHVNGMNLNNTVTSTWQSLPPQINNLHQELTVISAHSTTHPCTVQRVFALYTSETKILDFNSINVAKSQYTFNNSFIGGLASFPRFSSTISKNRLYTIDRNNKQWTVAEILNPLDATNKVNPGFLYVQSGSNLPTVNALRERSSNGQLGKTIALGQWVNQCLRCDSAYSKGYDSYELISLQNSVPEHLPSGQITIHTANMQSKQLLVREIALKQTKVSKVKTYSNLAVTGYNRRNALNFKWLLPDFLENNSVKATFKLRFNHPSFTNVYGQFYDFEYVIGRSNQMPYNGHLLPIDSTGDVYPAAFSDFDLSHLTLQVKYNEDWIPILNSNRFTTDRTVRTKPCSMSMQATPYQTTHTITATQYDEADVSTFQDSFTLLFYPLPAGIHQYSLEYRDTSVPERGKSVPESVWRPIIDSRYTGHAIAAPADSIRPGIYEYRLKAKNAHGEAIDLSSLGKAASDGSILGQFTVAHGGTLTTTKSPVPLEEVVRPVRKQTTDRWGNVVSSTSAAGNTTLVYYNGRNKAFKKIDPQIEVTDEHGVKSKINPETRTVYDLGDNVIAVSDANGHTTWHQRDNHGKTLKTTLPDGVFKLFILDIFGRTRIIRDPLNHDSRYQYDRCNREVLLTDACQWETRFAYNELGDRLSTTNGNQETERYDYLHPSRQPTHHYLPGGDRYLTVKEFERHGVLVKEELPDKRQNTWEVDPFGNLISHIDLGGAQYTYTLNEFYPTELVQVTSIPKQHGERRATDGSIKPMPHQNIKYQYDEASHVIAILDDAIPLTTAYRYDHAGRRARETFIASDGHIHQAVLMKWNALDWLDEIQDTVVQVKYSHDAKGNRRSTIAAIFWDNVWRPMGYESWYTYSLSDSMVINRGVLSKEGTIQIAPNKGTMLLYDVAGRRDHEITIKTDGTKVNKSLFYLDNNLLSRAVNTSGEAWGYAYDGKVSRRKVFTTNTTEQISAYTSNGWLIGEHYRDDAQSVNSSTTYDLTLTGIPSHQTTRVRNKEGTDGYDDSIDTEYAQFDGDKISVVRGSRQRMNGARTQSSVNTYFDPNGNVEFVVGDNQEPRTFLTNSNNRIVLTTEGTTKKELRFYTPTGQVIGTCGNIPPGFNFNANEIPFANLDLNYHPVSEHFPPPAPSSCVVMVGDTFASISERMYGDQSFAHLIAEQNGLSIEDKPPVGLILQISNLVSTNIHNWEGQYPVYNPTAIIGSQYPNMPMPQRMVVDNSRHRAKHSFWHVLVEAIVGTAIMAFAPELGGVFSGIFNKILGEALGFALAGAASNLVQQEIAIGFGDQKGFSLNAIGQSALLSMGTAGIAKVIGLDLMKSPQYHGFLESAVKNIELTIATQGLSFATGQQRHFDWRVMLASVANTLANVGAKQVDFGSPMFNDAVATASASVASIGIDKLLGNEMSSEAIAANTLGTFIGNQLAAQAKQHFAEYQLKKGQATQARTQIPEIQQELEESERKFIQSVLDHPNAHGSMPSPTPKPGHHAPVNHHASNAHHRPGHTTNKTPPQQHLKAERAREEAILSGSSQKPHASQHRFWSVRRQPNHSQPPTHEQDSILSLLGVNPTVSDLLSPVKDVTTMGLGLGLFRKVDTLSGKYNINYDALLGKKGSPYSKIVKHSHYYNTPGSPIAGDASRELQIRSIDAIITAAKEAHLSLRDTAHVLAIARHESGFNPYAAAGTTSAAGLGQFTDGTWSDHRLSISKIWDIDLQAQTLVSHFKKCQIKVSENAVTEDYIYKFHHDGLYSGTKKGEGLNISQKKVFPQIDSIGESISKVF